MIGILYLLVLFLWIAACLFKRMKQLPASATDNRGLPQMAIALGIGVVAASFTTNVLELFPSNVSIWMVIGMALFQQHKGNENPLRSR